MSVHNISGNGVSTVFDAKGNSTLFCYESNGNEIKSQTDYSAPSWTHVRDISISPTQGMELRDGVLFQFRGSTSDLTINDLVTLFDFSTGNTIKSNMSIDSGHANAVAFSDELYDSSDEFPLIYCGDWFDPITHVNRINRNASQHVYDIVYDGSIAGYHANPCIDFKNKIMYTVGYHLNSTRESLNNYCILCKWNIANMTVNQDGTRTPPLINSENIGFIYVMQDLKFNDGYIWIASGADGTNLIYAINPSTGATVHTVTTPITTEIEGIVWGISNGLYLAHVGFQGGKYYRLEFAGGQ